MENTQYIVTLMELFTDMQRCNDIHKRGEENRKIEHMKKNRENGTKEHFYEEVQPYSDTMLHNIISIINKLNNNYL